jgi:hypothetical protein
MADFEITHETNDARKQREREESRVRDADIRARIAAMRGA